MERNGKTIQFRGIKLLKIEVDVLKEIEKVTEKIPLIDYIENSTFGFTHKESSITRLRIYDKGLTSLPESIGNLKNLQNLRLAENKLKSLPKRIGNLTELTYLGLEKMN